MQVGIQGEIVCAEETFFHGIPYFLPFFIFFSLNLSSNKKWLPSEMEEANPGADIKLPVCTTPCVSVIWCSASLGGGQELKP